MFGAGRPRSLTFTNEPLPSSRRTGDDTMKRRLYFTLFAVALLVLALLGWTVEGLRWAFTGNRRPARRPQPARLATSLR
jgi:hypothetical protein